MPDALSVLMLTCQRLNCHHAGQQHFFGTALLKPRVSEPRQFIFHFGWLLSRKDTEVRPCFDGVKFLGDRYANAGSSLALFHRRQQD